MSAGMKGLLVGSLLGCLAAWSQWDGHAGAGLRLIIVGAAIGFAIGYFIGKRRIA